MQPLTRRATAAFSALTLVGVLSGAGLGGETLNQPGPLTLGFWLAGLL